jgi:CheY-like chemotaxis protein
VDDQAPVSAVTRKVLEAEGHRVTVASDAPTAFESLEGGDRDFDALVTDDAMPRMTGLEPAAAACERDPDLGAVLSSGYLFSDPAGTEGCARLKKPFTAVQLTTAVHMATAIESLRDLEAREPSRPYLGPPMRPARYRSPIVRRDSVMVRSSFRARLSTPLLVTALALFGACGGDAPPSDGADAAPSSRGEPLAALWNADVPAFGVYAPNERTNEAGGAGEARPAPLYTAEGGRALAENPLYDYVFLNLEGRYDAEAISAMAEGLASPSSAGPKALLVRIPSIADAGLDATRDRIAEVFERGGDGVVLPHVRGLEEARIAIGLLAATGENIWTPTNPDGDKFGMLMLEDPEAMAQAGAVADLDGYSVLACGIGSLTGALGGDREAAEALNQDLLAETKRVGLADMITANADNVAQRVREGFLGLLMAGPSADEVIRLGRAAAGR